MTSNTIKRIGIAIVEQAGHFLIGTRGPEVPLAGFAEFPGGKCGESEATEDCAVRECLEETGLFVQIERPLMRREHTYPHGTVDLHFYLCHPSREVSLADEQRGFRWVPANELAALPFPEANADVVSLLTTADWPQPTAPTLASCTRP